MSRHFTSKIVLAAFCGLAGVVVLAAPVWADGVSSARVMLDSAERQVASSSSNVADARRQLDWAVSDHAGAMARLASVQSSYDSLRSLLDDPNLVPAAQADAENAAKLADEKATAASDSKKRLTGIDAAIEQIRADAKKVYESSPAYVSTGRAVDESRTRLEAATAAVDAALQNDPQYQSHRAEADRLNQQTQVLRDRQDADPQQLTAASQRWIEAAGRAGTYRQERVDAHPAVVEARAGLRVAQEARQALEARFQNDLATDPNLIAAGKDRAAEQQNLKTLTDDAARLQKDRAAAESRWRDLQARMISVQRDFDWVNMELASAQNAAQSTGNAVVDADQRLRFAMDVQNQALSQRDAAARDLRLAIEDDRREQAARDQLIHDRQRTESDREAARRQADAEMRQRENQFNRERDADTRQAAERRSQEARQREQSAAAEPGSPAADRERDQTQRSREEAQQRGADAEKRLAETQQRAAAEEKRLQQESQRQQQEAVRLRVETQRQADARQRDMEARAKADADRNQRAVEARQKEMEAQAKAEADRNQRAAEARQKEMEAQSRQSSQPGRPR